MSEAIAQTRTQRVLIVDDEPSAAAVLGSLFAAAAYGVRLVESGTEALAVLDEFQPDVVVTDLVMPGMGGMDLLRALREVRRDLPVIVATGAGDVASAVGAMRAGAQDYITKPIRFEGLLLAVERAIAQCTPTAHAGDPPQAARAGHEPGFERLVGTSSMMNVVYHLAKKVAPARASVLITGETGTGKGELARAIHQMGPRAEAPFVTLQCAALAESLLESELFGHEKGAFTGADRRRAGRFEQANRGTLFLDEIGELTPAIQVKLLRVLQERSFERVGGNDTIVVDVRVLAATHRDLQKEIREGRFREDLYYRLNVVHIDMPALRLRAGDLLELADHFLRVSADGNGMGIDRLTAGARVKLISHGWPGNVRELANVIERAVVMTKGRTIGADVLLLESNAHQAETSRLTSERGSLELGVPGATMAAIEKYAILATLAATQGSTGRAAEMLDLGVRTVQYKLNQYGAAGKARSPAGKSTVAF